jgi:hypothetical protein
MIKSWRCVYIYNVWIQLESQLTFQWLPIVPILSLDGVMIRRQQPQTPQLHHLQSTHAEHHGFSNAIRSSIHGNKNHSSDSARSQHHPDDIFTWFERYLFIYLILATAPKIPKGYVYYYIRNPPPSAVRCAQVSGREPPLQKSEERK